MKLTIDILEDRISAAMAAVTGRRDFPAIVRPSTDPKFGDYQANGVMALAKKIKINPRKLAEEVVKNLDVADICESPETAGPGFINLRLKPDFIAHRLLEINADSQNRLGVEKITHPKTVVVDFSGPNIAKQMHVGHLRSTVIGDCICRTLEFLGHNVIRQNHIGDWGLPMGAVIYAIRNFGVKEIDSPEWGEAYLNQKSRQDLRNFYQFVLQHAQAYPEAIDDARRKIAHLKDENLKLLESWYKRTTVLEKQDAEVAEEIRKWTFSLQHDDVVARMLWEQAREITLDACFELYDRIGDKVFDRGDICGESFYKDMLPDVVEALKRLDDTRVSEGAVCVFGLGFKTKKGEELPLIVQKSDGAYLYATTDLAAIRYRVDKLEADEVIYVTDARQSLHFNMVFAVADKAGWAKRDKLHHVTFGSVIGENGKPLKTREGENIKLKELLDEAVKRAKVIVQEKKPNLSDDEKNKIAQAVGIGAVKYADYSNSRTSDYVFSFDKMLAMDGNTAPYMQYAYARIKSIDRKGQVRGVNVKAERSEVEKPNLTEPSELDLAKHLIRYGEAIESAVMDYRPNYLTTYLYGLAQKFSIFYTNCPVLDGGPNKRPVRLLLCDLTAKTIKHGLSELLGIEVVEQM